MAKQTKPPRTRAKRVGIRDIAAATGLAVGTVSMALRGDPRISTERRALIEKTAAEMGYRSPSQVHADRTIAQGGLTRIGMAAVGCDGSPPLLKVMRNRCGEANLRLEYTAINADSADAVAAELMAFSSGLDGIVVSDHVQARHLEPLIAAGVPYCLIGNITLRPIDLLQRERIKIVSSDHVAMARMAVHGLHSLGYRRIGFGCGRLPAGLYNSEWRDGFHLGCRDLGLDPCAIATLEGQPTNVRMKSIFGGLLQHPSEPEAYLIVDSSIAALMVLLATESGRPLSPQQLVVGDSPPAAAACGLERFPCIGPDQDTECGAAITRLQQQVLGLDVAPGRWMVPCIHHRLPWTNR